MQVQQEDNLHFGGRKLLEDETHFPDRRQYKDPLFAVLFYVVAAGVAYYGFSTISDASSGGSGGDLQLQNLGPMLGWIAAGCGAAFVTSFMLIMLLRAAPSLLVWVSLLAAPVICFLVSGWFFMQYTSAANDPDLDVSVILYGAILCLVLGLVKLLIVMCWRKYIPMTALVLSTVSHVLIHKLNIIIVALIAAAFSLGWSILCVCAIVQFRGDGNGPIQFVFLVIFFWGMLVFRNVGYFSYCSVFAQWYYGRRLTTTGSVCTALTTSFGSICFGSLLVAIIRALRYMAEECKRSDNAATKIVGYVLVCLLRCIEDVLEWFTSIVYVQCAIRGLSFCEGAKATCALATSSNLGKICAQLLALSVTGFGSFLSALTGVGVSYLLVNAAVTDPSSGYYDKGELMICLVPGFFISFFIGYTLFGVVNAGVNTILVCWAETPTRLAETHAEVHNRFQTYTGYGDASPGAGAVGGYPGAPAESVVVQPTQIYAAQAGVQPQVMHPPQAQQQHEYA